MKNQPNKEDKDLISRYLLGQLEGEELQQTTLRLLRDAAFRKEVDANRVLMKTLWQSQQERAASSESKNSGIWWWLIPLILIVAVLMYFLWPSPNPAPQQQIVPSDSIPHSSPLQEDRSPNISPPEKIQQPTAPTTKEPPVQKERPSRKALPIAADLTPSPMLEMLMDNPVRAEVFELIIERPLSEDTLVLRNGQLDFRLSGQLTSPEASTEVPTLLCYLFTNKPADFEAFEAVFSQVIALQPVDGSHFTFSIERLLTDVSPGLYYILIGDEQEEEVFYVERVLVR